MLYALLLSYTPSFWRVSWLSQPAMAHDLLQRVSHALAWRTLLWVSESLTPTRINSARRQL